MTCNVSKYRTKEGWCRGGGGGEAFQQDALRFIMGSTYDIPIFKETTDDFDSPASTPSTSYWNKSKSPHRG